jgi:hypothetical protein
MRFLLLLSPLLLTLGCRITRYHYQEELAFRNAVYQRDVRAISAYRAKRVHQSLMGVSFGAMAASAPFWGAAWYHRDRDHDNEMMLAALAAVAFDVVALVTGLISNRFLQRSELAKRQWIMNYRAGPRPAGTTGTYGHVVPDPLGGVYGIKQRVDDKLRRLPKPRLPRIPIPGLRK